MYAWLTRLFPVAVANTLAVLWYVGLIALVYALWGAQQAAFRYIQL